MDIYTNWAISMAWVIGMMVSPEALLLQGNFAGLNGFLFMLPLAVAVGVHWLCAWRPKPSTGDPGGNLDEIDLLSKTFGKYGGTFLLLLARPAVAVCLATATLVTSGFVFNETFVYRFPNFAFAGLLLIVVLVINLAGPRTAAAAQVVFAAAAVIGLFTLCVAALFVPNELQTSSTNVPIEANALLLAFPAFVGFDMLRYTEQGRDHRRLPRIMGVGLLAGGAMFLFWNSAALRFVPAARLAETAIPHILTAKAIAGQTGRMVIGIVGIAGTCAAVNLLFQSVARMLALMAQRKLLPSFLGRNENRTIIPLLAMAALTGLLMTMGFAGSENLDIAIRAGLLLWLLFYGLVQLAIAHYFIKPHALSKALWRKEAILHLFLFVVMIVIVALLALHYTERLTLFKMMVIMSAMAAAVALSGLKFGKQ